MTGMRKPRMYIAKDGTKTWKVRYRLGAQQSSHTFKVSADARRFCRWLAEYGAEEAVKLLKEHQGSEAGGHTVASWCTDHIDHLTGVTVGTTSRYRSYVERDLGTLAEVPVDAVTPRMIGTWVKGMEAAGSSGKTIKNKHGFLSAAFATAVAAGLVPSNPCKGTRLPRTVTEPMVFLTHDEYTRFLDCFTPKWQPLVETLFSTGLRWGEATALRVGDVDLDQASITIVRAWKEGDGAPLLGAPKSRKSRRTIAIAPETVDVLRPLVRDRKADEWVFVNARGEVVKGTTFHDNAWQPAVRLANGGPAQKPGGKRIATKRLDAAGRPLKPLDPPLGKRPRIHDARHSCASWLLAAGVPINYVQAHLGHESITTTVDRYGHIMPAARQAVTAALSVALSQSRPQIVG